MSFLWQETFFFFFALSISLKKECQKTEDVNSVVKVFFKGACQPCLWTSVSVISQPGPRRWVGEVSESVQKVTADLATHWHSLLTMTLTPNTLHENKQVQEGN